MNDKARMVALHKDDTYPDNIVWIVEIDGVKTSTSISQKIMDAIPQAHRYDAIDKIVNEITRSLMITSYPITDKEKDHLNKLLQCMT